MKRTPTTSPRSTRRSQKAQGEIGQAVDHPDPLDDRLRLAARRHVRARTASRSAPTTSPRRKKLWAGRSSRRSSSPTTCARTSTSAKPPAPRRTRRGTRSIRDWKRANADLAKQFERALRRQAARRPALADVQRRERQRRDARRRRHRDERDRQSAAGTRRRFGRPRSVDEDLPQGLRRVPARHVRRTQRPLRRARARDGGRRSTAWRLHGGLLPFCATFFNFLDYCKPALRLAALNKIRVHLRLHPRLGVLGRRRPDAPTDRAARDAARDAQRHRPAAGRRARNARSVEVRGPAGHRARR